MYDTDKHLYLSGHGVGELPVDGGHAAEPNERAEQQRDLGLVHALNLRGRQVGVDVTEARKSQVKT